jgi:hypothetical protein
MIHTVSAEQEAKRQEEQKGQKSPFLFSLPFLPFLLPSAAFL